MKKVIRRILILLAVLLLILLAAVAAYLIYFFTSYYRIADHQQLEVDNAGAVSPVQTDTAYTFVTYNIGFGAYSADYSFFMDGGTESRAFSKDAVLTDISGALDTVQAQNPDFFYLQEVDLDSTRSYHVDEYQMAQDAFPSLSHLIAIDFDSPYLFYPLLEPHGKSKSSIATFSRFAINSAERRSLPLDKGFSRYTDLDRCFSVSELSVSNGKKLYLYNVHLSAYSNEPTTVQSQVAELVEDMQSRYDGGNYIIVGGDFNQDVLGNSAEVFGTTAQYSWTRPFDKSQLPDFCTFTMPTDKNNIIPTCRLADSPYVKGESFVISIDGFIVSNNISVSELATVDTGFAYSDHNPVRMRFTLNG